MTKVQCPKCKASCYKEGRLSESRTKTRMFDRILGDVFIKERNPQYVKRGSAYTIHRCLRPVYSTETVCIAGAPKT